MSTAELATKIGKLSDTDEIEAELIKSMKRSDVGFTRPVREVSQRMKKKYCYSEKPKCDYLISTDDRLLKYKTDKIILLTPTEFVAKEG